MKPLPLSAVSGPLSGSGSSHPLVSPSSGGGWRRSLRQPETWTCARCSKDIDPKTAWKMMQGERTCENCVRQFASKLVTGAKAAVDSHQRMQLQLRSDLKRTKDRIDERLHEHSVLISDNMPQSPGKAVLLEAVKRILATPSGRLQNGEIKKMLRDVQAVNLSSERDRHYRMTLLVELSALSRALEGLAFAEKGTLEEQTPQGAGVPWAAADSGGRARGNPNPNILGPSIGRARKSSQDSVSSHSGSPPSSRTAAAAAAVATRGHAEASPALAKSPAGVATKLPTPLEAQAAEHRGKIVSGAFTDRARRTMQSMYIQRANEDVTCRICEQNVHVYELDAHTTECLYIRDRATAALDADRQLFGLANRSPTATNDAFPADGFVQLAREAFSCWSSADEIRAIREKLDAVGDQAIQADIRAQMDTVLRAKEQAFREVEILEPKYVHTENPMMVHREVLAVHISDFEILKPLTKGGYARVYIARKKRTNDIFALKVMDKSEMVRKNQEDRVKIERSIMSRIYNPFIVKMFYSFHSERNLYLVMEYIKGGDLFSLLDGVGRFDEEMARAYAAEIVLALEYLHSEGVVHRDLKPDNLLVTEDGHIKLTDFGLSQGGLYQTFTHDAAVAAEAASDALAQEDGLLSASSSGSSSSESGPSTPRRATARRRKQRATMWKEKRYSMVGTPDYLAPEIILGVGHSFPVDWWALGVMLYEFLVGMTPFAGDSPAEVFGNILEGYVPFPEGEDGPSADAQDLILQLLNPDPDQRLGSINDSEDVKAHPFFRSINWMDLLSVNMPFKPTVSSDSDTSYFSGRDEVYGVVDGLEDVQADMRDARGRRSYTITKSDLFSGFTSSHSGNLGAMNRNVQARSGSPSPANSPTRVLSPKLPSATHAMVSSGAAFVGMEGGGKSAAAASPRTDSAASGQPRRPASPSGVVQQTGGSSALSRSDTPAGALRRGNGATPNSQGRAISPNASPSSSPGTEPLSAGPRVPPRRPPRPGRDEDVVMYGNDRTRLKNSGQFE